MSKWSDEMERQFKSIGHLRRFAKGYAAGLRDETKVKKIREAIELSKKAERRLRK